MFIRLYYSGHKSVETIPTKYQVHIFLDSQSWENSMYCLLIAKTNSCHKEQNSPNNLFSEVSGMVSHVENLTTLKYLIAQEHSVI